MNYILWLFAGAGLGSLFSIIMHKRRPDLLVNIAVGSVGAFMAGFLLTPMFYKNAIDQGIISLPALIVSLLGAVILLVIVTFFRRQKDVKNSVIDRHWQQILLKMQPRWGKLTDQDITQINNHHDQLLVTLQDRYGLAKNEAVDQIQRYVKAILNK